MPTVYRIWQTHEASSLLRMLCEIDRTLVSKDQAQTNRGVRKIKPSPSKRLLIPHTFADDAHRHDICSSIGARTRDPDSARASNRP
jgi:hypothetical protein